MGGRNGMIGHDRRTDEGFAMSFFLPGGSVGRSAVPEGGGSRKRAAMTLPNLNHRNLAQRNPVRRNPAYHNTVRLNPAYRNLAHHNSAHRNPVHLNPAYRNLAYRNLTLRTCVSISQILARHRRATARQDRQYRKKKK